MRASGWLAGAKPGYCFNKRSRALGATPCLQTADSSERNDSLWVEGSEAETGRSKAGAGRSSLGSAHKDRRRGFHLVSTFDGYEGSDL